ncbi:MAG: arylamine N-acetyltransferase [Kofleriaceae bacterium]|nr:arylamine N-acetyltransferase [Kofleriaceae bacterium]
MSHTLDLDAYFRRIQSVGTARVPTLNTLNQIVAAHVQAIPFENLDILLGRPISLEIEDLETKLVHNNRGGYCFEQNTLLLHVLRAIGFDVTPISGRVRIGREREDSAPRTHLFLRVEINGETWLADVGVGALSPTSAIRLCLDTPQKTPHEPRRIVAQGDWNGFDLRAPDAVLFHQAKLGEHWSDVCEFTLEPMPTIDRIGANWYTSTHHDSHFRNRLVVAKAEGSGRISLLNSELKTRDASGQSQTQTLESKSELLRVLRQRFQLHFASDTVFPV